MCVLFPAFSIPTLRSRNFVVRQLEFMVCILLFHFPYVCSVADICMYMPVPRWDGKELCDDVLSPLRIRVRIRNTCTDRGENLSNPDTVRSIWFLHCPLCMWIISYHFDTWSYPYAKKIIMINSINTYSEVLLLFIFPSELDIWTLQSVYFIQQI